MKKISLPINSSQNSKIGFGKEIGFLTLQLIFIIEEIEFQLLKAKISKN